MRALTQRGYTVTASKRGKGGKRVGNAAHRLLQSPALNPPGSAAFEM